MMDPLGIIPRKIAEEVEKRVTAQAAVMNNDTRPFSELVDDAERSLYEAIGRESIRQKGALRNELYRQMDKARQYGVTHPTTHEKCKRRSA